MARHGPITRTLCRAGRACCPVSVFPARLQGVRAGSVDSVRFLNGQRLSRGEKQKKICINSLHRMDRLDRYMWGLCDVRV